MSNPLDAVIATIVARLEQGVPPWRQPWSNGAVPGRPLRSSGEPFTGSNAILLAMSGAAQGFSSRYWFTFQQALGVGACVRRGSKASPAILYKTRVVEAAEAAETIFGCRRRKRSRPRMTFGPRKLTSSAIGRAPSIGSTESSGSGSAIRPTPSKNSWPRASVFCSGLRLASGRR